MAGARRNRPSLSGLSTRAYGRAIATLIQPVRKSQADSISSLKSLASCNDYLEHQRHVIEGALRHAPRRNPVFSPTC